MSFDVLSEVCGGVNLRSDAIERNGDTKARMKWNNFGVNLLEDFVRQERRDGRFQGRSTPVGRIGVNVNLLKGLVDVNAVSFLPGFETAKF
jgi:hypothetical protein